MPAKVAIVPIQPDHTAALRQAIDLLGGVTPLNTPARDLTIKIDLFELHFLRSLRQHLPGQRHRSR